MKSYNHFYGLAAIISITLAEPCLSSDIPDPEMHQFNIDIDPNGADPLAVLNIKGFYGPVSRVA